ncbi:MULTISPECIES: ABC transporter permease [unclassified Treponema]|uniref:ABC transporter permease n=1 Tax=unclassified Treponema TaxID=2638727 RepID=UPI0020A61467|nr:FtsX-like permease family protein [Treponema sp. OMZ 906]UTC54794.1 ABC transporter permease [Treponema sp. OMZ 906]
MNILKIAFRNLNRQKRRSMLLVIAIVFAFLIVTLIDGLSAGARKSLEYQIAKIIGGHVYVTGAEKAADKTEDDKANEYLPPESVELVHRIIKEEKIDALYTTVRAQRYGTLIFAGNQLTAQIAGCKFDEEEALRNSFAFKEGGWENVTIENALFIPQKTAEALNVALNDVILYEMTTLSGQATVAEFQIAGIYQDQSQFDQIQFYANFDYLNKIAEIPEGCVAQFGIFLRDENQQDAVASIFEKRLAEYGPVTSRELAAQFNPTSPGQELLRQLNEGKWDGTKYAVMTFYDFAPQMVTLSQTIQWVSLGVLLVLLLVTMIGISNTFRMVVHERKGEIGTMRSCGVSRGKVSLLFLAEAGFLSVIGAAAGFVLALLVMLIISLIPISIDSVLSMLTTNGHFLWILSPTVICLKFLLTAFLAILAALGPAIRAANMIPAEALRSSK